MRFESRKQQIYTFYVKCVYVWAREKDRELRHTRHRIILALKNVFTVYIHIYIFYIFFYYILYMLGKIFPTKA